MKKGLLTIFAVCLLLGGGTYFALKPNSTASGSDEANQALISFLPGTKAPPVESLGEPVAQTAERQQISTDGPTVESLGSLLVTLKSQSGELLPDVEMEIRATLPGASRQEILLLKTNQTGQAHFENVLPGEIFVATSTF